MKQKTLLVVDVQNGFFAKNLCNCNPKGFFGDNKLTVQNINKVVDNIESAITHFRREGFPIVYVKAVSDPQYLSELRFNRYEKMYTQGFLKDRTWSTEFYRISPREGELVFKKGAYNPFQNPDFKEYMLRTASDLILTGFFSDICIDAVMRTADEKDVGIPTDIIADCSIGLFRPHQENLRYMKIFYGTRIHNSLSDYILNNDINGGMENGRRVLSTKEVL
jgi:nicotinamidase-related amidase